MNEGRPESKYHLRISRVQISTAAFNVYSNLVRSDFQFFPTLREIWVVDASKATKK
jgi:hypothetical protein